MITLNNLYQKIELICERIMDQIDKGLDVLFKYILLFLKNGLLNCIFIFGWLLFFGRLFRHFDYEVLNGLIYGYLPGKIEGNVYAYLIINIAILVIYSYFAYKFYQMFFFRNATLAKKLLILFYSLILGVIYLFIMYVDIDIVDIFPQIPIERNAFWYGR